MRGPASVCLCVCVGGRGYTFPWDNFVWGGIWGDGTSWNHGMFAGLSLTTKEATTICKIVEILPRKIGLSR